MVHGKNRIPYRIDRRLTGLAGPDYDATISFGLPLEPEDSQYGKSRLHPHFPYQPYKTTYHNSYEQLKGNKRKGIAPLAWDIPDEHDPEDLGSAFEVANSGGVPLGVLYRDESRLPFEARIEEIGRSAKSKTVEQMIEAYAV